MLAIKIATHSHHVLAFQFCLSFVTCDIELSEEVKGQDSVQVDDDTGHKQGEHKLLEGNRLQH